MQSEQVSSASPKPARTPSREPVHTLRRSAYPSLVGKAMLLFARAQTRRWDEALSRIRFEQERALADIVAPREGHRVRPRARLRGIRSYEDFVRARARRRLRHASRRSSTGCAAARANLLVPEFVRYFGNSSGSSNQGKPKFLPITDRQIRHQQRAGTDTRDALPRTGRATTACSAAASRSASSRRSR